MKKTKTQKGITLIALIITIIVLLILAVVAISAVQDSGIIVKAKDATKQYAIAEEKEQITLAYTNYMLDKKMAEVESDSGENPGESGDGENSGESSEEDTLKVPGAAVTETADGFIVEFSDSGNSYSVSFNGEIELMEMIEEDMGGENAGESESGGNITPGQPDGGENAIDYEAIATALTGCLSGSEDFSESVTLQILKDNGAIEEDEDNIMNIIESSAFTSSPDQDEEVLMTIYFEKIDAAYKLKDNMTVSYCEDEDELEYKIIKSAYISKKVLEDIFLGETEVPEDLIPTNLIDLEKDSTKQKKFLDYIVEKSNGRIKSIDKIAFITMVGNVYLNKLVLTDENNKEIILETIAEDGNKVRKYFGYEDFSYSVAIKVEDGVGVVREINVGFNS